MAQRATVPLGIDNSHSEFGFAGSVTVFLIFSVLSLVLPCWRWYTRYRKPNALASPDWPPISELPNFRWYEVEPLQLRPFKSKYNLTMALENLNFDDLILMDKNYKDRMQHQKKMMAEHYDNVVGVCDENRIGPAIREFYNFIFATYLPTKYPSMFKMERSLDTGQFLIRNTVTGEVSPALADESTSGKTLLENIGSNIDENFFFLLPETCEKDPKYVLHAYFSASPTGFNPREKLGQRLSEIHRSVPGYKEKLQVSMDRYFNKIPVGKAIKRFNWSINLSPDLYAVGGKTTHAYEGEVVEELDAIEVEKTFVRSERQTMHRLPRSRALVFAFKTYMYPISQIKAEGSGEQLAEAIDGLRSGNVPGIHFYKRGAIWGPAIKRYLRS